MAVAAAAAAAAWGLAAWDFGGAGGHGCCPAAMLCAMAMRAEAGACGSWSASMCSRAGGTAAPPAAGKALPGCLGDAAVTAAAAGLAGWLARLPATARGGWGSATRGTREGAGGPNLGEPGPRACSIGAVGDCGAAPAAPPAAACTVSSAVGEQLPPRPAPAAPLPSATSVSVAAPLLQLGCPPSFGRLARLPCSPAACSSLGCFDSCCSAAAGAGQAGDRGTGEPQSMQRGANALQVLALPALRQRAGSSEPNASGRTATALPRCPAALQRAAACTATESWWHRAFEHPNVMR